MTTHSPFLVRNRSVTRLSDLGLGDISTSQKLTALNGYIAGSQVFEFDIPLNITTRAVSDSSSMIRVPSGVHLVGNPARPIDMSMMANSGQLKFLFRTDGTAGTFRNLTVNLARGATYAEVGEVGMTALGLVRGSKVSILSDKLFIAGGDVGIEEQGEIITVTDVSTVGFSFQPPAQDTYLTADVARVAKLTMARGITMEGIRGIAPGQFATDTIGDRMFHMIWADGLQIDGCESDYFDNGSYFISCVDSVVRNMRYQFQEKNERESNQYGIALVNACQDMQIISAYGINGKHGIVQTESNLARGISRRNTIERNTVLGTWNHGIAMHSTSEDWYVYCNHVQGCAGGIELGARRSRSKGNEIRFLSNAVLGSGIGLSDVPEDISSEDDRVYGGLFGFRLNTTSFPPFSGATVGKISVRNMYVDGARTAGVQIISALAGPFSDVEITNLNTRNIGASDSAGTSITVNGPFNRVRIDGGNLQAATGNEAGCILTAGITDGRVRNIDYAGHAAPILGGTDVTSANVGAF